MLKSQKPHIGIFGRRNVGKSSLINALTGQDTAIVSATPGTTTDPVTKTMEIPGIGPIVMTDTAGIDDHGELGAKRVERTAQALDSIDLGVIVFAENRIGEYEARISEELARRGTPFFLLHNKADLAPLSEEARELVARQFNATYYNDRGMNSQAFHAACHLIDFSALHPTNKEELVGLIQRTLPASSYQRPTILGDLVSHGDIVLLVVPIDAEAPEGRLILPQVQTIRDCLDNDCAAVVVKERELDSFLRKSDIRPALVVTDSQAFLKVDASVPKDIPLTSFSILFARMKGDFERYTQGTPQISRLADGDRVLILESCSHHVAGDDIGRVKIPRWISSFAGKRIEFETAAGVDKPERDMRDYKLVIQCGGCMLTRKQVNMRLRPAIESGVPVTNYGMAIAWCLGIYNRAIAPFACSVSSADYL